MEWPAIRQHIDINSAYASIAAKECSSLRGKPVAVCGSEEERHGIMLAASRKAKKYSVRTGNAD